MLIYPMNAREIILNMLEMITGARMTYNYVRIGGVWADLPPNFEKRMEASFEEFNRLHFEFLDLLEEAQIFRIRTQGIGTLTREEALDYGTVGPVARASGVDFDVRCYRALQKNLVVLPGNVVSAYAKQPPNVFVFQQCF